LVTGVCLPPGGAAGRFSFDIDFGTFALTAAFGFFDRSTVNDADEQESVRSLNQRQEKHVHTRRDVSGRREFRVREKRECFIGLSQ
jgi:hypothetical protein